MQPTEHHSSLSVWPTAQAAPATQRKHRYTPESTAHPAKMLPATAAHAIRTYTQPGELVLDPMCGIGTTEHRWAEVTDANLELAHTGGATGHGQAHRGDARSLATVLPEGLAGQVALVVTSPPYGPSTHGQVNTGTAGLHKRDHRYGNTLDRGNLANIGHHRLLSGFTRILTACTRYLRPGGHVAITLRPWREHAELIDLPSQIAACGTRAGLIPTERCVALLSRIADDHLVARGSFFQRDFIRKQRDTGLPLHLIAHEDVLIFRTPVKCGSSPASAAPDPHRSVGSGATP